jgi:hypothetical protein
MFADDIFLPNIMVSPVCLRYEKLSVGAGVLVFQSDDLP